MYTPAARRGTFLLVVILLLISILLEQAIAGIFPVLGQLGGVRPMIVFLDIPLESPMTIDWLPVGFIFIIFYSVVSSGNGASGRGWAMLGHWWLLLIFLLIGGGIYYGLSGFLPKAIRNGIESVGMRADLTLPYPSGETIHLQGSMIMLAFFIFGWRLLINKATPPSTAQAVEPAVATAVSTAARPTSARSTSSRSASERSVSVSAKTASAKSTAAVPAKPTVKKSSNPGPAPIRPVVTVDIPIIAPPPPEPILAEAALPYRGRFAMRVPEPVEVKKPGGRPCIYVAMPAGVVRKRTSYPCVVEGGIRPAGIRQKELLAQ